MNQPPPTHEDLHKLRVQQLFMVHQQALLAYLLSRGEKNNAMFKR
jgi:hypothetical protein